MSTSQKQKGTVPQYLSNVIIRGIIATCLTLPLSLRLKMIGAILRSVVSPSLGYKRRAMENLNHIYPEMQLKEKNRIADAVCDNAGRTFIENYDVQSLKARLSNVPIQGDGFLALKEARETGKPVILVTGHFGNFEAPRAALVARGYQIGGLYRPMSNPYFNAHYADNMHRLSGPVFEQGRRGTAGLFRHIKHGGMGVLLFDIYDRKGTPIDFLGQPAPTLTSAAEIALKTKALLITMFGLRKQDGMSFDIILEPPIAHSNALNMTIEMSQRLEKMVNRFPEQWFWIHRRWKPERQKR